MAHIIFSQNISSVVGKLGSTVYQRGNPSQFIKNVSTKRNNQNLIQVAPLTNQIHNKFKQVVQTWQTLTGSQQNAWQAVTGNFTRVNRVGAIYAPSSYQLFCEMNFTLNLLNGTIIITPPSVSTFVASIYSVAYDSVGGIIVVNQSPVYTDTPYKTIIYAGNYQSNGLGYRAGLMKVIALYQFSSLANSLDITTAYTNLYGSFFTGKKAYFLIKQINVNTGELHTYGTYSVNF